MHLLGKISKLRHEEGDFTNVLSNENDFLFILEFYFKNV